MHKRESRVLVFSPVIAGIVLLAVSGVAPAAQDCMDESAAIVYWQPIREQPDADGLNVNDLALELVSCLGSPNPELRDRIAYELFSNWLRAEALTDPTRTELLELLSARLADSKPASTLSRSFSALVLAELMRSDGIAPFMNDRQRQTLLDVAMTALQAEKDFRGLDSELGWVHPVAHMSDLLWRFALDARTSKAQAESILVAVQSKVAPTSVSYAFNEGDRLARVVATLIAREIIDAETAGAWIGAFQSPQTMERWSESFQSPAGMAELHNTKQFLRALSDQLAETELAAEVAEPLNALVKGFTQLI